MGDAGRQRKTRETFEVGDLCGLRSGEGPTMVVVDVPGSGSEDPLNIGWVSCVWFDAEIHYERGDFENEVLEHRVRSSAITNASPELLAELREARERLRLIVAKLNDNAEDLAADRYGALTDAIERLADLSKPRAS